MLEIELKVRVSSLEAVRTKLVSLGGIFSERLHEHDVYYNAPHRDFGVTDEALRVRYGGVNPVLTYKGPKKQDTALKAREELNLTIGSGENLEEILTRLGFIRVACVDKNREYYSYRGASIALDEVEGLGTFVEVEVTSDGSSGIIQEIARDLSLDAEPIRTSYLELLLSKK